MQQLLTIKYSGKHILDICLPGNRSKENNSPGVQQTIVTRKPAFFCCLHLKNLLLLPKLQVVIISIIETITKDVWVDDKLRNPVVLHIEELCHIRPFTYS